MMRRSCTIALLAAAIGWAGLVAAADISAERYGVGLRPPGAGPSLSGRVGLRVDPYVWRAADIDNLSYGGERPSLRDGVGVTESYGGIYYSLSEAWGATLEAGVLPETALLPRRYSLAGQLHTALAGGGGFSVGLKYRVYESDPGSRAGIPADAAGAFGYALVPSRIPGASYGPSYQLQLTYQYNAANIFGFALGREVETFTPGFEGAGNGRQFTFTGQHWLTPSWALSYDLLSNDPGAFRLQGLRFGVRYRF